MPNRNRAPFIPDAVGTILKQTFKDIELVFVDDDSNDDSIDIVHSFMKRDKRVRLIIPSKASKDMPVAERIDRGRNIGNYYAKASIICAVDSEDWCSPKRAEVTYYTLRQNLDCRLFYSTYSTKNIYGQKDERFPSKFPAIKFSKQRLKETGLFFIGHLTLGYYKDLILKYPYNSDCGVGDWGMLYNLLVRHNIKSCYSTESLTAMRISRNSELELSWEDGEERIDRLRRKKKRKMALLGDL